MEQFVWFKKSHDNNWFRIEEQVCPYYTCKGSWNIWRENDILFTAGISQSEYAVYLRIFFFYVRLIKTLRDFVPPGLWLAGITTYILIQPAATVTTN